MENEPIIRPSSQVFGLWSWRGALTTPIHPLQRRTLQTRAGPHEVPLKHKSAGKSAAVVASLGFIAAGFLSNIHPARSSAQGGAERDNGGTREINP